MDTAKAPLVIHRGFLPLLALAMVSACGAHSDRPVRALLANRNTPPPQPPSEVALDRVSLSFGGQSRSYDVHLPPGGGHGKPAIIVFHGGEGTGQVVADGSRLSTWADSSGFVAIYPNSGDSQWNDGRDETAKERDDVGFVRALIADAATRFGIDTGRVFAAGVSNGGMFSQRLACDAAPTFRAFAVVAANMPTDYVGRCHPARAVPIIFFCGTDDRLMPWDGGEVRALEALGLGVGGTVLSHEQTMRFWLGVDGCTGSGSSQALPARADDGTHVTVTGYAACSSGVEVRFYVIHGGGHTWPGGDMPSRRLTGKVSQDVDASQVMVEFFRQYGL